MQYSDQNTTENVHLISIQLSLYNTKIDSYHQIADIQSSHNHVRSPALPKTSNHYLCYLSDLAVLPLLLSIDRYCSTQTRLYQPDLYFLVHASQILPTTYQNSSKFPLKQDKPSPYYSHTHIKKDKQANQNLTQARAYKHT